MSLKNRFISAITLTLAVTAFSTLASAQDSSSSSDSAVQQNDAPKQEQLERREFGRRGRFGGERRGGKHGDRFMMHGLRSIELTDAQKEQLRGIMEANRGADQGTREEMRTLMLAKRQGTLTADQQERLQTLKAQKRQNAEQVNAQVSAILTPEQRTQLEQMREEMRQKWEQRRQMRQQTPPALDQPQDN